MTAVGESRAAGTRAPRRASWLSPARARIAAPVAAALVALAPAAAHAAGPPGGNPDGRRFEQVSPIGKAAGDITRWPAGIVSARGGDRVAFGSNSGFSDGGSGTAGMRAFSASRDSSAWLSDWLTPVTPPDIPQIFAGTQYKTYSEDGTKAIVTAFSAASDPAGVPDAVNIYQQDVLTGALRAVTVPESELPAYTRFELAQYRATTPDLSHVVYETAENMTDDTTAPGRKVYEWVDGRTRLASILPNGDQAGDAVVVDLENFPASSLPRRRTISDDGSRVVFMDVTDASRGQIYLRKNGSTTAWVSQAEVSPPPAFQSSAQAQAMSSDGRRIVLGTDERLLPADADSAYDLYLYTDSDDPANDSNLTLLTPGTAGGSLASMGVLGVAIGADRVFYFADQSLDPGNPLPALTVGLYLWRDGAPHLVGTLQPSNAISDNVTSDDTIIRTSRMSEDGRALVYTAPGAVDRLFYVYDDPDEGLQGPTCISCPQGGGSIGSAYLQKSNPDALTQQQPYDTHNITADGRKVYFDTTGSLVAEDQNEVSDVYEYDADSDAVSLVSNAGTHGSFFGDASDDGSTAFFWTRDRLVGWDEDDGVDVYAARAGGGFPEPPPDPTPCAGEGCQPGPVQPPVLRVPITGGVGEPGNADDPEARLSVVKLTAKQRKTAAKSGRLVIRAKVNTSGTVTAAATARIGKRTVTVASSSKKVGKAQTAAVTLRLSRAARKQLKRKRRLTLRVAVSFTGVDLAVRQQVVLRAAKAGKGRGR